MQLNEVGMASFVSDVVTVLSTKGVRLVPEEIKKNKNTCFSSYKPRASTALEYFSIGRVFYMHSYVYF